MPVITLTTDFGLSDHYVGTMKGVILRICPGARIVDLSHDVAPYETGEASFVILQAYRYFPRKTVHVGVVDPGVGTSRRPILVEAAGQYFVGPDNGIFSLILAREKHKVRAIAATRYFLNPLSKTFHGRDVFAPVAAHLAKGVAPAKFGKPVEDFLRPPDGNPVRTARRGWTGTVLKVDRFGNMITNFHFDDFARMANGFEMLAGMTVIRTLASSYQECQPGEPFLIVGSSGYVEISVSQGSAARLLGCGAGAPLELTIY